MISAISRPQPVYDRQQKFKGSRRDQKETGPAEEDVTTQPAPVEALAGPGNDLPRPRYTARNAIAEQLELAEQLDLAEHPELKLGKISSLVSHLARGFGLSSIFPADATIETISPETPRKAVLPKSAYPKET